MNGLLRDKTRPSSVAPLGQEVIDRVLALTATDPPHEATHWTAAAMAKAVGISGSSVQRIWKGHGLAPHRLRRFGHMSDTGAVGRVGGKAMLWFVSASLVSLSLGLILVNIFQPGDGVHNVVSGVNSGIDSHAMTLDGFIKHVFPDSAVRPMVDNETLQIVVFSIFFGVACAAMGARSKMVLEGIEGLSHIILRVTGYFMMIAPIAVFCATAATTSTNGLGILVSYAKFMGEFYFGLICLWGILIVGCLLILGPSVVRLVKLVQEPFLLAFSTASSEAAYPKMLEQLAKFPISRKISSFVLPLEYSKAIHDRGTVLVGHRDSSIPFSF